MTVTAPASGPTRRRSLTDRLPRRLRNAVGPVVFLIPMLLVFGLFSWWPIVRSFIMSVQQTNLVTPAEFVGLDNFRAVLDGPAARDRRPEHRSGSRCWRWSSATRSRWRSPSS